MRIHIVTMSIGLGHNEAARMLAKKAVEKGDEVRIYHPLEMYSERLFKRIKQLYKWLITNHPNYWRKMITKNPPFIYDHLSRILQETYQEVMEADIVLSVHPLLSAVGGEIKMRTKSPVPFFHVATDFWQSPLIQHHAITARFVPTNHALSSYDENERMYITGLPIEMNQKTLSKKECCLKYGWDYQKPIIVISGGGEKMFPFQEVKTVLSKLSTPTTMLLIGAAKRYVEKEVNMGHDMYMYPFMKEFKEVLKVADVLISKAGGMTAAEAIAAQVPTIFYKPLPGHEEGNAELLCQERIAYWAKNIEEVASWTERLLQHEKERQQLKHRMKGFIPLTGTERIIALSKCYASTAMFQPQIDGPRRNSNTKKEKEWSIS